MGLVRFKKITPKLLRKNLEHFFKADKHRGHIQPTAMLRRMVELNRQYEKLYTTKPRKQE